MDNVEELRILLYDGTRLRVGAPMLPASTRSFAWAAGVERSIRDCAHCASDTRIGSVSGSRRSHGGCLATTSTNFCPKTGFHVARALVGSEGTCAIVLEARVTLIDSPQHRALVGIGYPDTFAAADTSRKFCGSVRSVWKVSRDRWWTASNRKGAPHLDLLPEGRGYLAR